MFGLRCLAAASCLVTAVLACQEYELDYAGISGDVIPLLVQACANNETITYHMPASDNFEDVTTFEDYTLDLGASRVASQEACYVRLLSKTFDEQISFLEEHKNKPMTIEGDAHVEAIPIDDVIEEMGDEIANFCGDYPAYKLVRRQDDDGEDRERQVAVTFQRCVLLCFIQYVCYTTTLTVPTGPTITFTWFFFG